MSGISPGNLHGNAVRTNKMRYHNARLRVQDSQKTKSDEGDSKVEEAPPPSSINPLLIVLIVMIVITWGIAATAYFGVVDYKGMLDRGSKLTSSDAAEIASSLYPFQYNSVRHPLRAIGSTLSKIDDVITSLFTFERARFHIIDKRRIASKSPSNPMKAFIDLSKRDAVSSSPEVAPESTKSEAEVGAAETKSKQEPEDPKTVKRTEQRQPDDKAKEKPKPKAEKKKKPKTLSDEDKKILTEIKAGEKLLDQKKGEQAWKYFKDLTQRNPGCPKAKYLEGKAAELTASQQRSNPMVSIAIDAFGVASEMPNCPKELKKLSLMAKSENQGFLGRMVPALETMRQLAKLYPTDVTILNKLGVRYLMLGKNKVAKKVYQEVLKLAPDDGFALVHMGFIVKNEGLWKEAIPLLARGTESDEPGTQEGKFYFHLGDALHRTNRTVEADVVYEKAAKKGLFRSKYQRSLYNVERLRGQPFWTAEEAGVKDYVRRLELNWKLIRDEALSVMDAEKGLFLLEEESLRDTGEWRQFTLFARGRRDEANCRRVPKTCAIIERMPNAKGCRRGQVKFSVMMPGTHVWPHTGPTNCRLRMHLGLVIPQTGSGARLACAGEMRTWTEGKVMIFDDSFEHEVWQEAESFRLILIVDIWHPELTEHEKKTLTTI